VLLLIRSDVRTKVGRYHNKKNEEKENVSQKILITAFDCLSTKGYANVSMMDIANEASVALSQLTYYYKNKEGLFTEVIHMMMHQYLHEIEMNLMSAKSRKEKIASLVKYFKELINEKPNLLKLFIGFTAQALWLPSFRKQVDNLFESITKLIEKNILSNEMNEEIGSGFQEYSSKFIAKLILGALYGTSIQIMLGSDKDDAFKSLNLAENLLN